MCMAQHRVTVHAHSQILFMGIGGTHYSNEQYMEEGRRDKASGLWARVSAAAAVVRRSAIEWTGIRGDVASGRSSKWLWVIRVKV